MRWANLLIIVAFFFKIGEGRSKQRIGGKILRKKVDETFASKIYTNHVILY
jgi:hypothetical protein